MKIVIIGDGKVGHKLTTQLSEENYDVVLIDQNEGKLKEAVNKLDIFCITGNGAKRCPKIMGDCPQKICPQLLVFSQNCNFLFFHILLH